MRPRGKCPKGGKHRLDKRIAELKYVTGGRSEKVSGIRGKFWYCRKCGATWRRGFFPRRMRDISDFTRNRKR